MSSDNGYEDPFAKLDDGFGDLGYDELDDGLGNVNGHTDQSFDAELPLNTDDDFDEFGDPIVRDNVQSRADDQDQFEQPQYEQPAPKSKPQAPQPAESKPFLKTPIGMASAGAGIVVLGLVGYVGSKMIGGSGETLSESYPQSSQPAAPVAGDPNYNASTLPTQSAAAVVTEPKPVIKPLPAPVPQELPAAQQVAPGEAPSRLHASDLEEAPVVSSADEVSRLKAALSHQRDETAELKTALASLTQGISKLSAYAEKDHAEQVVLKEQVEVLTKRLEDTAKAPVASEADVSLPASKKPVTVNTDATKAEQAKAVSTTANPNAPGRYRLPGVKVVEATESGKMAIITKGSNGRMFTVFKGERLGTPRGSMTVTEVKDEGFLIFVGDKYYIDKVSEDKPEPAPVQSARAAQPAPAAQPTKRAVAAAKQKSKAAVVSSTSTTYTLNAVYDGGKSFGLVNSEDEFKSYRIGDELPGAGRITGLDANGNLKAGDKVIKSLY